VCLELQIFIDGATVLLQKKRKRKIETCSCLCQQAPLFLLHRLSSRSDLFPLGSAVRQLLTNSSDINCSWLAPLRHEHTSGDDKELHACLKWFCCMIMSSFMITPLLFTWFCGSFRRFFPSCVDIDPW
jgi:hypothetical protein